MRITIVSEGESAVIRFPASIMREAGLEIGQEVDIRVDSGRIVLDPVRYEWFDLDELVEGITDDKRHDLIDFGEPVGKEVW